MEFRHEWKHEMNVSDLHVLRSRLKAVMKLDPHNIDEKYRIRSLYFDNIQDKALRGKINGVFRLRYYNDDLSYILLEKKSKINGLCKKD